MRLKWPLIFLVAQSACDFFDLRQGAQAFEYLREVNAVCDVDGGVNVHLGMGHM